MLMTAHSPTPLLGVRGCAREQSSPQCTRWRRDRLAAAHHLRARAGYGRSPLLADDSRRRTAAAPTPPPQRSEEK